MNLISLDVLRAGDVLLCYKAKTIDILGKKIRKVTQSNYTHAAICIDSTNAVESVSSLTSNGVAKVTNAALVGRYDHVAVFRQPDAWPPSSIEVLRAFIERILTSGAKYNLSGVAAFRKRKNLHDMTVTEQLRAYFDDSSCPPPQLKEKYFCSELVCDCFVASGFIDPSAAIVYQSSVTSPGALGRDPTFGTFCGYITTVPDYAVPPEEEFFNTTTFAEIFGPLNLASR